MKVACLFITGSPPPSYLSEDGGSPLMG